MRSLPFPQPALAAACLALCAGLGCRAGADSVGLSEAHAAAIRDSVSSALDAFRELGSGPDPAAVAVFYSESPAFRFYENGALRYESAAEVRAALEGLGSGMRITTDYSDIDIEALAPGLALVRSLFESTLRGEGELAFSYGGAMTTVWVHEAAGWRILSGHTSAPVNGPG
ncbi:MAG: nuclear transport factor 2 family protein [Gemmatimonadetes bacterium]|nr:nuclear transport factor 2 family protein [Gemmatimonadota bacterium]MYA42743.1 nuclear transport factor 2 family protein [Gemmatimonadota bacterium]MYE95600.1 nuclear transport factor 2 family protein [Gemmatimonadota bacterium]MYJ11340.1 nuclear transport factor 2 family protein [Gemmatimonadota bacterium]